MCQKVYDRGGSDCSIKWALFPQLFFNCLKFYQASVVKAIDSRLNGQNMCSENVYNWLKDLRIRNGIEKRSTQHDDIIVQINKMM